MNSSEYDPRVTPWRIDDGEFYDLEDRRAQIEFLLRYAVLAPSGHNTQPWSFHITDDGVEVNADFQRCLSVVDPDDRELLMSIGAAITNLRVAAARFGFESSVLYRADADPLALVALRETSSPDADLIRLFPAIKMRHTNRHDFDGRALEPEALGSLCDFIDDHALTIHIVAPHEKTQVAELIEEGDKLQMANGSFRRELADWVRPSDSDQPDGISGDALGIPDPITPAAPWLLRRFDVGAIQSRHDRELAEHAPALLIVHADDDRVSLLRAGETLEHLLLLLTKLSLQYSFLNQAIEVPVLRDQLQLIAGTLHPPQLLLRVGYGRPIERATPRREVGAVVS